MRLTKQLSISLALAILAAGGGWFGWRTMHQRPAVERKTTQAKALYTCPMHPFIIKEKPGSCPICAMDLVRKPDSAAGDNASTAEQQRPTDQFGAVSLSPAQRVMANVATAAARQASLSKEINAVGIVQYDQSRQAKVTAWMAGRIDKLYVTSVGAPVSAGKAVAEIYSPDLVTAQQEYLLALKSREQFRNAPIPSIVEGGEGLVASSRQRLKLLGVTDEQLAALEQAGEPNIRLPITTPLSGVVIEKLVQEGQYVNAGDPLFNIADLSTVWIEVEVYENEFPLIKIGQQVDITVNSSSGPGLTGRVAFIYPFLDPKTRTVKVRVVLPNQGLRLKPEMYVTARIRVPLGSAVTVPVTALIDTGSRQVVWVESSPGIFEHRDVKGGERSGDQVQLLSGLKPGEKVAVSGGYLIDSEAQLKGGSGHEERAPVAPAPAKKGGLSMDDMKM